MATKQPFGQSRNQNARDWGNYASLLVTVPIYVNPGEFIAVAAKFLAGTATASQVIYHQITFDYGWE